MSEHFPYASQIRSYTATRLGIDNTPEPEHLKNMELTAAYMEVVRVLLGNNPIYTTSWYRSKKLNAAVKGSAKSQHCLGQAVDFYCPEFGSAYEICKFLISTLLPFDQLIYEGDWVHISFDKDRSRRSVLTAKFTSSGTTYVKGLVK